MAHQIAQSIAKAAWVLAAEQHGVIARWQLLELGISPAALLHRLRTARLHRTPWSGVYAVGRPRLTQEGLWMAAVLACGPDAWLSHAAAACLFGLRKRAAQIEVSVPLPRCPRRPGIKVHRRRDLLPSMLTKHRGIPVTNIVCTLVDVAPSLTDNQLDAAISEADIGDLVDPETLRLSLDDYAGRPGVAIVRRVLDIRTFSLTRSELERRFKPIARNAGLSKPLTRHEVNGFEVDFFWPELGFVVETDGLRYHRTAAQQTRDRIRDQTHTAAGLTVLRFTHWQIRKEPAYVVRVLRDVASRLRTTAA